MISTVSNCLWVQHTAKRRVSSLFSISSSLFIFQFFWIESFRLSLLLFCCVCIYTSVGLLVTFGVRQAQVTWREKKRDEIQLLAVVNGVLLHFKPSIVRVFPCQLQRKDWRSSSTTSCFIWKLRVKSGSWPLPWSFSSPWALLFFRLKKG